MGSLPAWFRLARPLFLGGGAAGVALGAAVAAAHGYRIGLEAYAGVQALVTAFQLMVHFANDYFDRDVDRVAARTRWSGGSGVLPDGTLPPRAALLAALVCAAAGTAATAWAWAAGRPAVATLGLAIGALAWAYSAPPLRLCARGLGELDTVLVVAVLVPLASYSAFAGAPDGGALLATLAPAAAMAAMILGVELPDAETDGAAGKRNLVVRFGVGLARRAFATSGAATVAMLAASLPFAPAWHAALALAPACALGCAAAWSAQRWAVERLAFLGVTLYACTVTGLAAGYAALAAAR